MVSFKLNLHFFLLKANAMFSLHCWHIITWFYKCADQVWLLKGSAVFMTCEDPANLVFFPPAFLYLFDLVKTNKTSTFTFSVIFQNLTMIKTLRKKIHFCVTVIFWSGVSEYVVCCAALKWQQGRMQTSGLALKPSCATATLLEEQDLGPVSRFASHGLLELPLQNETLYKCRVQLNRPSRRYRFGQWHVRS